MRSTHLARSWWFFAAIALAWGVVACTEKPTQPENDNPFDPNGTGGDPYELVATVTGDSVTLVWNDYDAVSRWLVYHSAVSGNDLLLVSGQKVTRNDNGLVTAAHRGYSPGRTNWYKVQAISFAEVPTPLSVGAAAVVAAPALVRLEGGGTQSPTRFVQLELLSDAAGDIVLSNSVDLSDSTVVPLVGGEVAVLEWTLPTVAVLPTDLTLYYRSPGASPSAEPDEFELEANLVGSLEVVEGASTSGAATDTLVVLRSTVEGAIGMRISIDEGDTVSVADPTAPFEIELSSSAPAPVSVRAFLASDFGPEKQFSRTLTPVGPVGAASMAVVDSAETTSSRTIRIVSEAPNATLARFSESVDFTGVAWVDYADTLDFELGATPGPRTVYGIFANPFDLDGQSASLDITLIGRR